MLKYTCLENNRVCFECNDWQSWGGRFGGKAQGYYKSLPVSVYKEYRLPQSIITTSVKRSRRINKKKSCPYCKKKFKDVKYHVSVKHGEKWDDYVANSKKKGLFTNTLSRCSTCGAMAKNILKHIKKVHINK